MDEERREDVPRDEAAAARHERDAEQGTNGDQGTDGEQGTDDAQGADGADGAESADADRGIRAVRAADQGETEASRPPAEEQAGADERLVDGGDVARLEALAERETAYGLLQRGHALLRRRHHAQAAVVLERAARLEPGKGSIVEALGRAYYNSGQHARAVEVFSELVEIDPSGPYAHFGLGQALKQVGRRDEARLHLRLAVALSPQSRLYRDALARLG